MEPVVVWLNKKTAILEANSILLSQLGRLGESAENLLQELAAEACRHARLRGFDACLQRSMARSLIAARRGLPGKAHR